MNLAPIAIVVPVLTAAVLAAGGERVPRAVANAVALAAAAATAVLCALLVAHVWHGTGVAWMGGWHPRSGGVVIGIDLAVDPLGAGVATFGAVLVTLSLVYSQRYFDVVAPTYQALLLILLTGVIGLCLTGDLFNLFVFFELMSVPAYALTAHRVEDRGPIQGGLGFALTNSIGSFLMVSGIGLIYGRTGALNLAQIGQTLAGHRADRLVVVAFTLIACGFLIKAAIVPFHFWLADAYAVAPVPVCVVFSGIMVELGLFGLARVYWTAFSGAGAFHAPAAGDVLLWAGVITAVVGAAMCFLQHHLKRLLAFSTITHAGLVLIGVATLTPRAMGAVALLGLAHGAINASLFMAVGNVGHRLGSVSEHALHGRGRRMRPTAAVMAAGGLALAGLPPFGVFAGKALVEEAAAARGLAWIPIVVTLCSAVAAGAILRVAARVFLGLGRPAPAGDRDAEREATEDAERRERAAGRAPVGLLAPTVALLLIGLVLGMVPQARHGIERAGAVFTDRPAYAARVIHGTPAPVAAQHASAGPKGESYVYGVVGVLVALGCAAGALTGMGERAPAAGRRAVAVLHGWHSGHLGDYATWAAVGAVVLGWALAAHLR